MPEISATIRINDAFSSALDKLSNGLSRSQSGFSRLKGALGNANSSLGRGASMMKSFVGGQLIGNAISRGMSLAGQGIHNMVGELNEASTSWQTFEGNMHQIGRTPAQIQSAKKDMQQFAQETIYSASDMASTYSQLAAVGTKNTGQLVRGFGGLAAASSNPTQAMKTLSEQATQMAAKPKVQWMDFKLMLEQSPAGISAVAKTMHTTATGLIKDVQNGKIKTQDFLNAVAKTGTNKNFSRMATQYKTVGQAMDGLKETLANNIQPAFDKVSKVGIKWVSDLTDRLGKINFSRMGNQIAGALGKININSVFNSFDKVLPVIQQVSSAVKQLFTSFSNTGALSTIGTFVQNLGNQISTAFRNVQASGLFSFIGQIFGNVTNIIGPIISSLITGLNNAFSILLPTIMNIAGSILNTIGPIFSTLGSFISAAVNGISQGLAPLASGFNQLIGAIQPLLPLLSTLGELLASVTFVGIALGIGVVVDALTSLISIAAAAGNAIKGIVQSFHALGDAMRGNFSGAKRTMDDAKNAFNDMKSSFGNVGKAVTKGATANMIKQFQGIGKVSKTVHIKSKVDTPKMPKIPTIKAPKVAKPKIPVPSKPKLATIKAPKVARPKVPKPTLPHLSTIKAPHVAKPNMSGVVSAVHSGMNRAAAAARAGGAALSAAVRSAVAQAVASGQAAAGTMRSVGVMIGQGLAQGMQSQVGAVSAAANALVAAANKAARAKAQVHSPSKLFAEIGNYMGQGMAIGMNNTSSLLARAGSNMIDSATPKAGGISLGSSSISSNGITPSAVTTSNYTGPTSTNNSRSFTIAPGAIQIHSSGNAEYDGEVLLSKLETVLQAKAAKML